jgi:ATP-dependent RNA helicase DDX6/DHH1
MVIVVWCLCVIVHVIVATPGRILDLVERSVANLTQCLMLVMDEADKLLAMNQNGTIDRLIERLPTSRQVLLFSATFPVTVQSFTVSLTS